MRRHPGRPQNWDSQEPSRPFPSLQQTAQRSLAVQNRRSVRTTQQATRRSPLPSRGPRDKRDEVFGDFVAVRSSLKAAQSVLVGLRQLCLSLDSTESPRPVHGEDAEAVLHDRARSVYPRLRREEWEKNRRLMPPATSVLRPGHLCQIEPTSVGVSFIASNANANAQSTMGRVELILQRRQGESLWQSPMSC